MDISLQLKVQRKIISYKRRTDNNTVYYTVLSRLSYCHGGQLEDERHVVC